ncbi:glycosyltransferase family 2 protein [Methylophaga sp.]|uniref:glycosyltransferase family 2 protein n=1 Tax=Methylophaga sp. TaxID=2024840 RepID=UPI003A904802
MISLAIIIVNYKTPEMALDVLESLKPEILNTDSKVVIVDNDSQDESIEIISRWIEQNRLEKYYELIISNTNTGFSGGNNLGIKSIKAKNYLLLNSDTLVRSGAIKKLLETAAEHPDVGMIGPRLEWPDEIAQESAFHFHSSISEFIRTANVGIISKLFSSHIVARPVSLTPEYYEWLSFACVLIKAKVFEDIGLLDDKFFMYFEDVEFSYRAYKHGWKIMYQPDARVVHLRGGSSPLKSQTKLRKRLPRYFYESRARYFYLLYGRSGLLAANLAWVLGAFISQIRDLFVRGSHGIIAEKQWQDIWINFTKPSAPYIHPKDYD